MAKNLEGKTIIVLGVGPAMGRVTALMCVEQGANVALGARSEAMMESVAKEIKDKAGQSISVPTDLNNAAQCKRLVQETVSAFGKVDGLVSIGYLPEDNKLITEVDDELSSWRPIMDTNFFGTMQLTKAVIDQMLKQGKGGSIVIINSMTTHLPWPRTLPYAASKAALASAARILALEYGKHQIRVNNLHCGAILNEALWRNLDFLAEQRGTTKEEEYKRIAALGALESIATPEEYVGSILYLLSDLSAPVTGISLHANSGRYMG